MFLAVESWKRREVLVCRWRVVDSGSYKMGGCDLGSCVRLFGCSFNEVGREKDVGEVLC